MVLIQRQTSDCAGEFLKCIHVWVPLVRLGTASKSLDWSLDMWCLNYFLSGQSTKGQKALEGMERWLSH